MICTVCGNAMGKNICSSCGYDRSRDLEIYPSPACASTPVPSKLALVRRRYESTAKKCAALELRVEALESSIQLLFDRLDGQTTAACQRTQQEKTNESSSAMAEAVDETISDPVSVNAGDIITFGKYPQGNLSEESVEKIDWIVLQTDDEKLLVISKNILEWTAFDKQGASNLWSESSLRRWINEDFLHTAFSNKEKDMILTLQDAFSNAPNSPAALPAVMYNEEIQHDKLFLLNVDGFREYYKILNSYECAVTPHTKKRGNGYQWWWLSTTGKSKEDTVVCAIYGKLELYNVWAGYYRGVRPCFYLKR